MAKETGKRSPLKDTPLRLPGQSLDERFQRVLDDKVMLYFLAVGFTITLAFMEWVHWKLKTPPQPVLFAILAIAVSTFSAWKLKKLIPELRQLRRGSQGEKAVGQLLERFRADGYEVFHDILGDKFNIDHVLIGPQGIFTIETKMAQKPKGRESEVRFDGHAITVDGFPPDRDPVVQSKAQARWLSEILLKSTGKSFRIQPVVVYPGWFVSKLPHGAEVWVLNEKALHTFVLNGRGLLSTEDVHLASYHLARHVQADSSVVQG